jgi:hypothetical protein
MFAGMLAAAAVGALGANAFVAFVAAVTGGLVAWRAVHAPPWTPAGRAAWVAEARGWRQAGARLASMLRARRTGTRWSPPGGAGDAAWGPAAAPPAPEVAPGARVAVRCEVATERVQVWHSMATRRAYEVPSERGLPGAEPGTEADLVFERGRPRVVRRPLN